MESCSWHTTTKWQDSHLTPFPDGAPLDSGTRCQGRGEPGPDAMEQPVEQSDGRSQQSKCESLAYRLIYSSSMKDKYK